MRLILPVLLLLVSTLAFGQQDPIYSQYLLNPLVINPAYAGINKNVTANAGYRIQWMGLEGQPKTFNLNGSVSLVNNKVGTGITLLQDRIGNSTITEFNASFSYKLQVTENKVLSFGMQGGMLGFNTNNNDLLIRDDGDDAFPQGSTRSSTVNLGAGAILKSERFMVGLSVPRMLPSKINSGSQQFELYNQHFYLFGSFIQVLSERLTLKPSLLLRGVKGAPPSADVGVNITMNNAHTAGVFTRNFGTYGLLLQTLVKEKYRIAYVFELPTSRSVGTKFLTHEVSIGLRLAVLKFHETALTNF